MEAMTSHAGDVYTTLVHYLLSVISIVLANIFRVAVQNVCNLRAAEVNMFALLTVHRRQLIAFVSLALAHSYRFNPCSFTRTL
jgi:hypothetical protein